MMRVKKVIEGLTVAAIGGILLANTFGALSWRAWLNVFALWPLLIIAVGIDIVGKGLGREWLRAAASLLVLAGLAYAVAASAAGWQLVPGTGRPTVMRDGEDFAFTEPATSAVERGVATIRGGAGTVTVRAGDALAEARGASPFRPQFDVRRDGTTALVDVSLGSHPWLWTGRTQPAELEVELSAEVPWDLTIETGAAELAADLRDVKLQEARIDCGVSESTVAFGAPDGVVPVELRAGVSAVTLRFPQDCSLRIRVNGALASVEGAGIESGGSTAETRTFTHGDAASEDRYEVSVQAGVSTLRIELY